MNDQKAIRDFVQQEISRRGGKAKILASKFPELKGLSWEVFLRKLPYYLDFVTASKMFEELNRE